MSGLHTDFTIAFLAFYTMGLLLAGILVGAVIGIAISGGLHP